MALNSLISSPSSLPLTPPGFAIMTVAVIAFAVAIVAVAVAIVAVAVATLLAVDEDGEDKKDALALLHDEAPLK